MSIEKSELKALVANNLGADFEDRFEAVQREFYQQTGSQQALEQASVKVPVQICAKIKTVLDEGGISDGMTPIQVAEFAIKQVMKCGDFLKHLAEQERHKQVIIGGRLEGLKDAMDIVTKMKETELAKAAAAKKAGEEGTPLRGKARPSGVRPGPSTASQRKSSAEEETASGTVEHKTPVPHTSAAEDAARKAHGSLAERRAAAKEKKSKKAEAPQIAEGTNGKPKRSKKASRRKVTARRKAG